MNDDKINKHSDLTSNKSIVSIVSCNSYKQSIVLTAIKSCLKNIGGFEQFIVPGITVHIKPNLLSAKEPERAATTHPVIVRVLVDILHSLGAKVTIGDSPAGISRPIEEYWDMTGLREVAQQTGAQLIVFEKKDVSEVIVNSNRYFIAKAVAEADIIINLCKMKTHSLTLMTGAIKNTFGVIPGIRKGEYHKQAPNVKDFSEILVDIYEAVKPQINIMDAVLAMEGNGPSSGSPKDVGLIIASTDGVALDSVASSIMGFQSEEILTNQIASNRGLGVCNISEIEFIGLGIDDLQNYNFQLPSNHYVNYVPEFLMKFIGKLIWVRPKVLPNKCKRCCLCIKNCPVIAMESNDGIPKIDYKQCIKCFCCDEICPHDAIEQQMSLLAKKFK